MWWIPVILFAALCLLTLIATEIRERKRSRHAKSPDSDCDAPVTQPAKQDGECCGMHLVCERETMLQQNAKPVYYDDEELDALAGIDADKFTKEQTAQIAEIFNSMNTEDVTGWVRSLQMRGINIPDGLRDEILLVVREQRSKSKKENG